MRGVKSGIIERSKHKLEQGNRVTGYINYTRLDRGYVQSYFIGMMAHVTATYTTRWQVLNGPVTPVSFNHQIFTIVY